jgi:tetratricopeptide (TPR) repeat protein
LWELAVKVAENLEEEEAAYRELVRRFPDEPKYAVSLGATLINEGKHAQARTVLEPLTKKGTQATRGAAHYQLARSNFRQNKPDKALHQLEEAGKADADVVTTSSALQFRGRILEKLGRPKEAAEAYRHALRLEADAEEALLALVRLNSDGGDAAEALDHLRRYTLLAKDVETLATAADWHLRLGRYEDALELANRAREIGFHEKAQRVLGLVYLHQGKYEQAVFHLGKASPDGPVLEGLLRGHLILGNLSEAEAHAGQVAKVASPSAELRQACDRVKALADRRAAILKAARVPAGKEDAYREAAGRCACAEYAQAEGLPAGQVESLVDAAFDDEAELGPAYALRGQQQLEKGRLSRALADADKAVALSPDEARGYYVRGRVRLERGAEGALADLEKAAKLGDRKDGTVLHWLAAALARAGRTQDALAVQREAVKCKPGDRELQEQLDEFEKSAKAAGGG